MAEAGLADFPDLPFPPSEGELQLMSRAFVKEDAGSAPEPSYNLPEGDSPYYDEAAAWALIQGADQGDSVSAERATGYRWGETRLVPHVRKILEEADASGEGRVAQLARRYLRAAG
jgi:hypothetical protein